MTYMTHKNILTDVKMVPASDFMVKLFEVTPAPKEGEGPPEPQHFLRVGLADDATWYTPFAAGWLLCSDQDRDKLDALFKQLSTNAG